MTANLDGKMNTIRTKFLVISLPRTGTKSICQMAKQLGLEVYHAPGPAFSDTLNRVDFIADTPTFRPSVFEELLDKHPHLKFIYLDKDENDWVESMNKVNLSRNYNGMHDQYQNDQSSMSRHNMVDYMALHEILDGPFTDQRAIDAFRAHKQFILENIPSDRLLVYNFSDGWDAFAKFVEAEPPELEIPHLNKDTMFDNLS